MANLLRGSKSKWSLGLSEEKKFWRKWFYGPVCKDLSLPTHSRHLLSYVACLLPAVREATILDVGSGAISWLGGKNEFNPTQKITIVQADPLTPWYVDEMERRNIFCENEMHTVKAEELLIYFSGARRRHFDLIHTSNALDHSEHPVQCINSILELSRRCKCPVFMWHIENCADVNYGLGLHRWNFTEQDGVLTVTPFGEKQGTAIRGFRTATIPMSAGYNGVVSIIAPEPLVKKSFGLFADAHR